MIPEAPEAVREAARLAFAEVQLPSDDGRRLAIAPERIRNINSPRGIKGLKIEQEGGLWETREHFDIGFVDLSFQEKKRTMMSNMAADVVPWQEVPAGPGQPGYIAFHAAGLLLLAWWTIQVRKVTANLGRAHTKPGRQEQQRSDAVLFLADEFLRIANVWSAPALQAF